MKRIYLLLVFLFVFNISFSQCAGPIILTSNPSPDSLGFFAEGTSVTFTLTLNGYDSTSWFEGLSLNYGNGWDLNSLQSIMPANSNDGEGEWGIYNNCKLSSSCQSFGKGFYYDRFDFQGNLDAIPGNDLGDGNFAGGGSWTFTWSISVDSLAGNTSLNGSIILLGYPWSESFCEDIFSMNSVLDSSACQAEFSMQGFLFAQDTIHFSNTSSGNTGNVLWSLGDGASYTSNNFDHSYSDSGTFNVCLIISDSLGCFDSVCALINICPPQLNSIKVISQNQFDFFNYPNPVSDILNLNLPLNQKFDCMISDIQSSKKYSLKLNEGENKIDVSMLPSGIYFIRIFNNQNSFVSKFVKE